MRQNLGGSKLTLNAAVLCILIWTCQYQHTLYFSMLQDSKFQKIQNKCICTGNLSKAYLASVERPPETITYI